MANRLAIEDLRSKRDEHFKNQQSSPLSALLHNPFSFNAMPIVYRQHIC